ncbi:MAG: Asp/Glu racemase [Rhodospirillales bacterium]|nr:Asp/Glu racemase [Rhodospirillales bacterium]
MSTCNVPTARRHPIFDLADDAVADALSRACAMPGEGVLMTGTGMPTLHAMSMVAASKPVLSSNLCLAWSLLTSLGYELELRPWAASCRNWVRMRP